MLSVVSFCIPQSVILTRLSSLSLVSVVLYSSVAGSLLCQVMYSLLLLPLGIVQPLLSHLLPLLEHLNNLNRVLPETEQLEEQELGTEAHNICSGQKTLCLLTHLYHLRISMFVQTNAERDLILTDKIQENTSFGEQHQEEEDYMWIWLLDLERSVALAVGRCLGGMLQGPAPSFQEKISEIWLSNVLLRNGLETHFEQLGRFSYAVLKE